MKSTFFNSALLLLTLTSAANAFASLPTTNDAALKPITQYGFFFSSKRINFITSAESADMAAAVLDDDLNVHYVMCAQSENEPKSDDKKIDWETVRLQEVNAPQNVNIALFGAPQQVAFKDFLLGLQKGKVALARLDQDSSLIECRALDTFTQQELMSVGEEINRQSYRPMNVVKAVASGLSYGLVLSHFGWVKCVDDEASPYYRIQEEVKTRADKVDSCKDMQQLTGFNRQQYLYAQGFNGLQSDVFKVRQMVNKIEGKPVVPATYENIFGGGL